MEDILIALEIMGLGMLGIFVVILLIIGVVSVLTRLSQPRADSDSAPDCPRARSTCVRQSPEPQRPADASGDFFVYPILRYIVTE